MKWASNFYYGAKHPKPRMHGCWNIISPLRYGTKKNWPFCCRGQLNNDSHWRSRDDGRPWTIHRKGSEISWGFVYRFGSHKRGSLNLTDQTDQAENRAGPVNSEDYGNGCLASNHFCPPEDTRGLQFDSVPLLLSSVSGANRPRRSQTDWQRFGDWPTESQWLRLSFFFGVMILQNRKYEIFYLNILFQHWWLCHC